MSDAELAASQAWRTFEPLTRAHLDRLADLAARDHEAFTRPAGHPEHRQRRLLAVLAQGAARHYADCLAGHDPGSRTGVKDLDVRTFYSAIPGTAFPAARRETHADFGPSSPGRQFCDLADAPTARERALWRRRAAYQGRRVGFLMRALPSSPTPRTPRSPRQSKTGFAAARQPATPRNRPPGTWRKRPWLPSPQHHSAARSYGLPTPATRPRRQHRSRADSRPADIGTIRTAAPLRGATSGSHRRARSATAERRLGAAESSACRVERNIQIIRIWVMQT